MRASTWTCSARAASSSSRTSPTFDHNGDGRVDDGDLLFAVTLRSGKPDQALVIADADNNYLAVFVQDDWRVRTDLTLNLGLRYELDTDVKNISRYDEINPIVQPFLQGTRERDCNNLGPRVGFNWAPGDGAHERPRRLRHLLRPRDTGDPVARARPRRSRAADRGARGQRLLPGSRDRARSRRSRRRSANPFTGFILPGAGASGHQHHRQHAAEPERAAVQPRHPARAAAAASCCASTACTTSARTSSSAGPSARCSTRSSAGRTASSTSSRASNTNYDALLVSAERARDAPRLPRRPTRWQGVQLRERRPDPVRERTDRSEQPAARVRPDAQRPAAPLHARRRGRDCAGGRARRADLDGRLRRADGHPDARRRSRASRRSSATRAAGCSRRGAELNRALADLNASGGVNGAAVAARAATMRGSATGSTRSTCACRGRSVATACAIEPIVEVFNLFNVTNILGVTSKNYSGYANVLVRDSATRAIPATCARRASARPVTTAGGVFGSGGPRAFQFAVRATF